MMVLFLQQTMLNKRCRLRWLVGSDISSCRWDTADMSGWTSFEIKIGVYQNHFTCLIVRLNAHGHAKMSVAALSFRIKHTIITISNHKLNYTHVTF